MRLPVSIRAVPMTVSEPPSSKTRAVPKSRLGTSMARTSMPPLIVRPLLRRLVVGPGQPGQAVEQHEHLLALLGQPLGPLDHQFGHADVAGRVAVGAAERSPRP